MNFLMVPALVVGLLFSPASVAGASADSCLQLSPQECTQCAVRVRTSPAADTAQLQRQARKHAEYYRLLVHAQRDSAGESDTRRYTVHSGAAEPIPTSSE